MVWSKDGVIYIMVDWPPERAVVYHDNAPVPAEPIYRRGEYAANLQLVIASRWPRLPAAFPLISGQAPHLVRVNGNVVSALGGRINAIYVHMGVRASFSYACPPFQGVV
jgi:hypothetical protein